MLNTKLTILKYPHPILSKKSEDIDIMGSRRKDYIQFINQMLDMYNGKTEWGNMVGLAAPQVGKNWNIFVALNTVFVNPVLEIDPVRGYSDLREGCYSLDADRYDYPTKRAYKVILKWVDLNGEPKKKNFYGRDAQVIQHEYDHLQGKLCVDHVKN